METWPGAQGRCPSAQGLGNPSGTDLEEDDHDEQQEQQAAHAAPDDERPGGRGRLPQEDDGDLDGTETPSDTSGKAHGEKKHLHTLSLRSQNVKAWQHPVY